MKDKHYRFVIIQIMDESDMNEEINRVLHVDEHVEQMSIFNDGDVLLLVSCKAKK